MKRALAFVLDYMLLVIVVVTWGSILDGLSPLSFVQGQIFILCFILTMVVYMPTRKKKQALEVSHHRI